MRSKKLFCAMLIALILGLLAGCREEVPISGGTLDLTDPNAPKVIYSKEITSLDATFFVASRQEDGEKMLHIKIAPDDTGTLIASEDTTNFRWPANEALLTSLQEVIDRYHLAELNGVYRVTAGLAPGYWEGGLSVTYASGETLSFTQNNDPYAEWAEAFYDAFYNWAEAIE